MLLLLHNSVITLLGAVNRIQIRIYAAVKYALQFIVVDDFPNRTKLFGNAKHLLRELPHGAKVFTALGVQHHTEASWGPRRNLVEVGNNGTPYLSNVEGIDFIVSLVFNAGQTVKSVAKARVTRRNELVPLLGFCLCVFINVMKETASAKEPA